MPRISLQPIGSTRTSNIQLDSFQKGIIIDQYLAGQKKADV